ncbi:MAG: aromatic amino acid transaminase, partial [Pseudomonadota bacterium]
HLRGYGLPRVMLVTLAFREDDRPGKVDLGVGVFKDAAGNTPILESVKRAEKVLFEAETTKVYEGPRGNLDFCAGIERLLFGGVAPEGRVTSFTTPGGCGALGLGAGFLRSVRPEATVWMSDPCWPNHPHVFRHAWLQTASYAYGADASGRLDVEAVFEGLNAAQPGDVLLLQGPCHNPTGIDLDLAAWTRLAQLCVEKDLIPFIDIAYHGFAAPLDDDLAGVQAFLETAPEALISYSCSKNFGLYRERAGCLLVLAETSDARDAAQTHLASIARATYSMPPAHGAGIVATILADPTLEALWRSDVDAMRARLTTLRSSFADALRARQASSAGEALMAQNGMFSMLKLKAGAVESLRRMNAIYIPGSGRVNVAGLPESQMDEVAAAIAPHLEI